MSWGPPCLKSSAGTASDPGAFPQDSFCTALMVSWRDGGRSRSTFVSTCGVGDYGRTVEDVSEMLGPSLKNLRLLSQMLRIAFFTFLLMFLRDIVGERKKDETWSYTNQQSSPEHWAKTATKACAGSKQSPVPLSYEDAVYVNGFTSVYVYETEQFKASEQLNVTNNGHTFILAFPSCKWYLSLNGNKDRKYCIHQFHFHWGANDNVGSEHSIDGRFYPLEMHIVTFDRSLYADFDEAARSPVGLAVLGVIFHLDADINATQTPLHGMGDFLSHEPAFQTYQSTTSTAPIFPLAKIFPINYEMRSRFFRYDGSLTTPPCTENVLWTVMAETLPVTHDELIVFRRLEFAPIESQDHMTNNFRPLQKLNPPVPLVPRTIFRSWNCSST